MQGLHDFFITVIIIIVGILFLIYYYLGKEAIYFFKSGRKRLGQLTLIVMFTPPALFLYHNYITPRIYDAQYQRREARLANLPRSPITHAIRVIELKGFYEPSHVAKRLIRTGIVDTVIVDEDVYHAQWGLHCVNKETLKRLDNSKFINTLRARDAFMRCARLTKRRQEKAPIVLHGYETSKLAADEPCLRRVRFSIGELRWSKERGGQLIDYFEHTQKKKVRFFGHRRFFDHRCVNVYKNKFRPFPVIIAAMLGYKHINDILPQRATAKDALAVFKKIAHSHFSDGSEAAMLLLGQWPSTSQSSAYIRHSFKWDYFTSNILSKISYSFPYNSQDQLEFFPKLASHAAAFLAICPSKRRTKENCDSYREDIKQRHSADVLGRL